MRLSSDDDEESFMEPLNFNNPQSDPNSLQESGSRMPSHWQEINEDICLSEHHHTSSSTSASGK